MCVRKSKCMYVRSRRRCVKDVCVTEVNGGGRVLTAADRFQGIEVTIGVNGCLPKEQITIHIKTHPQPALIQLPVLSCVVGCVHVLTTN